jgi:hypothetical protein
MLFAFVIVASFASSSSLFFECRYYDRDWVISRHLYTCTGTVVSAWDSKNITGVSQNHLDGRSNADVGGIEIFSQPIVAMPRNIAGFFANIRAIGIKQTHISRLTKEDLKPFSKLEVFACWFSRLETIDGDVFESNSMLQHLNLAENMLTNIGPNILTPLPKLHQLSFGKNLCTDEGSSTADGIPLVASKLRFQCPPTPEMIEKFILSGQQFHHEIDKQTADRINPAVMRIYQNEKRIDELDSKVLQITAEVQKLASIIEQLKP